jgi:hypothetical protein
MSKKEKVYDVRIALPEDEQEEDYTETSYLFCWEPDYEWAIINGDQVISQSLGS